MYRGDASRVGLRAFLGSVAINAALGIVVLLRGDFGDLQVKILLTSFLVSAVMLAVLLNLPALTRGVWTPLPLTGAATGALGFALLIVAVWRDRIGDTYAKTVTSLLVIAAAATLAAALELATPLPRARWLRPATHLALIALVVTVLPVMWTERGGDAAGRLIGVESILVAAGTVVIPVLARFGGRDRAAPASATVTCPHCGESFDLAETVSSSD